MNCSALIQDLHQKWRRVSENYLPVKDDRIWRYSRHRTSHDPDQGWKIHVSATVLNASDILSHVGPLLRQHQVLFKAPMSLDELMKINSGLWYGYSQIGKFLTIYPKDDQDFARLAPEIHRVTRSHTETPSVPFDRKYQRAGSVFYRYGAFTIRPHLQTDGSIVPGLKLKDGTMMADARNGPCVAPQGINDPLANGRNNTIAKKRLSPLDTRFHVFEALSQRGKGGVYLAVDSASTDIQMCVLKEGRKDGETRWDGRDGQWLVKNEARVLMDLYEKIKVPRLLSKFQLEGNFYIATEYINGKSLQKLVTARARRLPLRRCLSISKKVAELVAGIHAAGWIWRDCKPANILMSGTDEVTAIDLEGACRVNRPDVLPWSTPSFAAPEILSGDRPYNQGANKAEDLYALGCCLFYIIEGRIPSKEQLNADHAISRKGVPEYLKFMIAHLLDPEPSKRPSAKAVASSIISTT